MRKHLNVYDAAAVAATYGSVGAVAFIAGTNFLEALGYSYDGYMIAALALMRITRDHYCPLIGKKIRTRKKINHSRALAP